MNKVCLSIVRTRAFLNSVCRSPWRDLIVPWKSTSEAHGRSQARFSGCCMERTRQQAMGKMGAPDPGEPLRSRGRVD